jgi:hypothetical protein
LPDFPRQKQCRQASEDCVEALTAFASCKGE